MGVDVVYPGWSNPLTAHTDTDTATDFVEFNWGSNPRLVDTDGDGLYDNWEIDLETDPTDPDTDDDGFTDDEETRSPLSGDGFDPLVYDDPLTIWEWVNQFSRGLCGACSQRGEDQLPFLLGRIGFEVSPAGDLRDLIQGVVTGNLVGVGFGAAGLLSVPNDQVRLYDETAEYVAKASERRALSAVRGMLDEYDLAPETERALVRLLDGSDELIATGLAQGDHVDELLLNDVLVRMVRGKQRRFTTLLDNLAEADEIHFAGPFFRGAHGVERHDAAVAFLDGTISGYFRREPGFLHASDGVVDSDRIMDLVIVDDADGFRTLYEVKTGYVASSSQIRREIANDALSAAEDDQEVVWVFFASDHTGAVGASDSVLAALHANGIQYEIWVPSRLE